MVEGSPFKPMAERSGHQEQDGLDEEEEEEGYNYNNHPVGGGGGLRRQETYERESVQPLERAATTALNITQAALKLANTTNGSGSGAERHVKLDGGQQAESAVGKFATNSIKTSKYNIVTFVPIFLFEMFSRVAYLYFLMQAALSWWEVVSPTGGAGSTMALMFVLTVAGVKAILEDVKRHREDKKTNETVVQLLKPDGGHEDIKWKDVQVGHIVRVKDDELIPADLLCLHSELEDNVCFVKTTNLDGESNLKIRRPLQLKELVQTVKELGPTGLVHIRGVLQCEMPNADLHNFKGRFSWMDHGGKPNLLPVTMNELLLRGTLLKNSGSVYGLVVYTGDETRIQKNNAKVPFKSGAYDKFLNFQIALVGALQILLCIFYAVMSWVWKDREGGRRYFLAFDVYVEGNYRNDAVYIVITFFTFWILESYMVPISLFVTSEVVKFWQGFVFINMDPDMMYAETREASKCRNSNIMEDLGKVDYVFSDKTGTLTCNDMRLRQIAVKGVVYGRKEVELENEAPHDDYAAAMQVFDPRMKDVLERFKKLTRWTRWTKSGGASRMGLKLGSSHRLNLEGEQQPQQQERGREPSPAVRGTVASAAPGAEPDPLTLQDFDDPVNDPNGVPSPTPTPSNPLDRASDKDLDEEELVRSLAGLDGLHLVDFWTNLCVCHSLIVETDDATGATRLQGPSPDEVALVNMAQQLGFVFKGRDSTSIYLDLQGESIRYEVLNVLEFSSERRRMSVIARAPDGTIRLFVKGADSAIMGLLNSDNEDRQLLAETDRNLHRFAQQGLRTLCVATRVLSEEEWMAWDAKYQEAAASLDDRDARVERVSVQIEKDLDFVGMTAIEDRLQDGVPESIHTLLDAGIRVWMITGDKRETAINIAVSCRLLKNSSEALTIEAESVLEASDVLDRLSVKTSGFPVPTGAQSRVLVRNETVKGDHSKACTRPDGNLELVIDGRTLQHILGTDLEPRLAELGSRCGAVVVCRASPSQKASIVKMMKRYEAVQAAGGSTGLLRWYRHFLRDIQSKMLAIGDGANDVAMIQAADVGVGVMGKEGRQAVNNSDFAIPQFVHLVRLLLVHGQLSDYRIAYLVKYSFYKNICFATVLSLYQFYNGFSGTTVIDDISAFMYNVVFTAMPIGCFALYDRTMSNTMLLMYPRTYNNGNYLTTTNFWKTGILQGILDGAIVFCVPFFGTDQYDRLQLDDVGSFGKMVFVALLASVTMEVVLASRYWTSVFVFFLSTSSFFVYPFIFGYSWSLVGSGIPDPLMIGVGEHAMANPNFWFSVILVVLCTTGHRLFLYSVTWAFFPSDTTILSEREQRYGTFYEVGWQTLNRLAKLGVKVPKAPVHTQQPHLRANGTSSSVQMASIGARPRADA